MPIKSASFKSVRQTEKRRARNITVKLGVKQAEKAVRKAVAAKDKAKAAEALKTAIKLLDRAKQKGVLKANTASRTKSRLHKAVANI